MRRILSRLLSRQDPSLTYLMEAAHEDWAPIPAGEVGTNWYEWLQDDAQRQNGLVRAGGVPATTAQADSPAPPAARVEAVKPGAGESPRPAQRPRAVTRSRVPRQQQPDDRRWRDVLVACAEHLTDEELQIVKQQMAR